MDEKFKKDLMLYLVSNAEPASVRLCEQIDAVSSNQSALNALFLSLESAIVQFKSKSEVPGLIGTDMGWQPLIKLLHALLINGDVCELRSRLKLKKRAFHALAELIPMSTVSAIGPHLEKMINLTLTPIDGGKTEKQQQQETEAIFEHLSLQELHEKCPSTELRLSALRTLSVIFDKNNYDWPNSSGKLSQGFEKLFPRLQRVLLALLADTAGGEEMRNLSNKCMSLVIANHNDPNAIFALLSDMSADTELMLKDDPLLDDLIEKCWARDNKLKGRGD